VISENKSERHAAGSPGKNDLHCMSGRPLILLPVPVIAVEVNMSKMKLPSRVARWDPLNPDHLLAEPLPNLHMKGQGKRV
jgi:hypothetical protein